MTEKLKSLALDLTKNYPRSPRETLGGFVIAARSLDKCRAVLAGTNGEYHFDSPWSPTRLDQRTGRVRRIGQSKADVLVASFRYEGSVEDTVWQRLSQRYKQIHNLMGTLPDVLRSAWVMEALDKREESQRIIDATPDEPPLRIRNRIAKPEKSWGFSKTYLDRNEAFNELKSPW